LALALVSAVTFGLSGPFAKALIDAGWSATGTVLVRLGGAAVVLAVILAATRPGVLVAIRRDGFGLLLYGVDRAGVTTPPLVLAGIGMVVGAVTVGLVGLVGLLPLAVDPHAVGVVLADVDVDWPVTAGLLVLVSTVVAYLTGIGAIRRIGASRASLVGLLEVISSAVASWLLLDEVPAAVQAVGGALILAGVSLTQTRRPPACPPTL
jgi:drug/metabolite transporter (DMT)-like permease